MRKLYLYFVGSICLLFFLAFSHQASFAQTVTNNTETYMKGIVQKVISESTTISDGGYATTTQVLQVKILDNPDAGKVVTIDQGNDARLAAFTKYSTGQTVVIDRTIGEDGSTRYTVSDSYRIPQFILILIVFVLFAIGIAGKKGIGAVIGLLISLGIIIGYIVPQVLFYHADPLTVSLIGSFVILFVTTFLAHGISKQTAIAVVSTFCALIITYLLAIIAVDFARLAGLGTEDSYLLEIAPNIAINPQGILLGGIMIGALGALNDVTTTQVATIFTIFKANPEQKFIHLVKHGMIVGREHITSMINTLVLAYAGISLPIFILLIINPNHLPLWVTLNSQEFGEELARTAAGSIGLMLAVPIATLLASYFAEKILKK